MWKKYDLTGKTMKQAIEEHPLSRDPISAVGKHTRVEFSCIDYQFMMFHLGDTYFFMNELLKTQPTTNEENDLFNSMIKVCLLLQVFKASSQTKLEIKGMERP